MGHQSIYLFCRTPLRHRNLQKCFKTKVFCAFWLVNVLGATAACHFSKSELQNLHFDLEMCFAPQQPAIIRHLNFKKWPEAARFLTFWLGSALRATAACNFSTCKLEKVVREFRLLYILTWKRASRHSGVQFFPHLNCKKWPKHTEHAVFRTFSPAALASLLFDPPEPRIIEKTQRFATFLTFRACVSSFWWLHFLLTLLLFSAFQLSILSEVGLLNFLRSFDTSALQSIGFGPFLSFLKDI